MIPFSKSIRILGQTDRGTVFAGPLRSGFYRSEDGLSWTGYDLVFPTDRIYSVEVDSRGFVYVGTDGAGLYRSSRPLAVATEPADAVAENGIGSAYPNPFSTSTTITYSLEQTSRVRLDVFDMLGRNVQTLAEGVQTNGSHTVRWDAGGLSNGAYLIRLRVGGDVHTLPVVLTR